jgi:hypothetical protein
MFIAVSLPLYLSARLSFSPEPKHVRFDFRYQHAHRDSAAATSDFQKPL